jgi:hypothetical protein
MKLSLIAQPPGAPVQVPKSNPKGTFMPVPLASSTA